MSVFIFFVRYIFIVLTTIKRFPRWKTRFFKTFKIVNSVIKKGGARLHFLYRHANYLNERSRKCYTK